MKQAMVVKVGLERKRDKIERGKDKVMLYKRMGLGDVTKQVQQDLFPLHIVNAERVTMGVVL